MSDHKDLSSSDRGELEERVNDHLSEGWIPAGALTYLETRDQNGTLQSRTYIQSMIRCD